MYGAYAPPHLRWGPEAGESSAEDGTQFFLQKLQNALHIFIGLFGGANFDAYILNINGATIQYGAFITAVINFLIMAFIVFLIVKGIHKLESLGRRKETPAAPTTKTCPYCRSQIDIQATRCPHCTSELADDPS